ncbi:MAG TPA: oxygen-independent coproporphyrinogen III oxidase [Tahibacter sp.]|uniref:oxygen-independent coproporphyrinogen III oxidase n=1 Tax=Tahibacter sp. TaxID=2056211 RepID=UPI002CA9AF5E|nr:oxygen-independent coproporphyrinogen III oxidase [Tahibacter sp.]HSX61421.1 oxygen-independent coproporphyrinogen III oxidase [Tahibacter sp.]
MIPHPALPEFDAALVGRYDLNGPRYTSYPTAPQFASSFGEAEFVACARRSNDDPIPRSLSLYVHVPFCESPCFYCGCTRVITRERGKAEVYLERLFREIELTSALFDRDRKAVQLHFGGGTPNFLDLRQMGDLCESLQQHFTLDRSDAREFGIEIDPRHADADYIRGLGELGFNRLSVGIQDFDPLVQQAVNRIQSVEQTAAVLDAARDGSFRSLSVDLIYGLPLQTVEGFSRTLDAVVALRPDRIAAYSYAHLPDVFKPQRQLDAANLPDARTKLALLALCVERLCGAGYRYVGMDHFALPTDELVRAQDDGTLQRNFQGYSTHGDCDLVGLGVSAISRVGDGYSQNFKEMALYYGALDRGRLPVARGLLLDDDDRLRGDAIMQLMCHGTLDLGELGRRHGVDATTYFAAELADLADLAVHGLVNLRPGRITVTPRGRFLLRVVAMVFDAYRRKSPAATVRHSRVI